MFYFLIDITSDNGTTVSIRVSCTDCHMIVRFAKIHKNLKLYAHEYKYDTKTYQRTCQSRDRGVVR